MGEWICIINQTKPNQQSNGFVPQPNLMGCRSSVSTSWKVKNSFGSLRKSNPRAEAFRADQGVSTTSRDPGEWRCSKYGWMKLFRGKCIGNKHLASQNLHPFPRLVFLYACGLQIIWLKSLKISPRRNLPFLITQVTGKWSPPSQAAKREG